MSTDQVVDMLLIFCRHNQTVCIVILTESFKDWLQSMITSIPDELLNYKEKNHF